MAQQPLESSSELAGLYCPQASLGQEWTTRVDPCTAWAQVCEHHCLLDRLVHGLAVTGDPVLAFQVGDRG